jgi:hypothetical protein
MFNLLDLAFLALQKCTPKKTCTFKPQPSPEYLKKVRELAGITLTRGVDVGKTYINTSISSLPRIEQIAIRDFVFKGIVATLTPLDRVSSKFESNIIHTRWPSQHICNITDTYIQHIQKLTDATSHEKDFKLHHIPSKHKSINSTDRTLDISHVLSRYNDTLHTSNQLLLKHLIQISSHSIPSNISLEIHHILGQNTDSVNIDRALEIYHDKSTVLDNLNIDRDLEIYHNIGNTSEYLYPLKTLEIYHNDSKGLEYIHTGRDLEIYHDASRVLEHLHTGRDLQIYHNDSKGLEYQYTERDLEIYHDASRVLEHLHTGRDLQIYHNDSKGLEYQYAERDLEIYHDVSRVMEYLQRLRTLHGIQTIGRFRDVLVSDHDLNIQLLKGITGEITTNKYAPDHIHHIPDIKTSILHKSVDKNITYSVGDNSSTISKHTTHTLSYVTDKKRDVLAIYRDDIIKYVTSLHTDGIDFDRSFAKIYAKKSSTLDGSLTTQVNTTDIIHRSGQSSHINTSRTPNIVHTYKTDNSMLVDTMISLRSTRKERHGISSQQTPVIHHNISPTAAHIYQDKTISNIDINRDIARSRLSSDFKTEAITHGEWHYLFDSIRYNWSMTRIKTHSDNPNIREYCYPKYTVYLVMDMSSFNVLVVDGDGNVTYDDSERLRAIEEVKQDMLKITYQDYSEIDVTPILSSLKCIKVTSTYRQPHYRDEAYKWFERQFKDPDSPLRTITSHIQTTDITADISVPCAFDDTVGDLYEKFTPDPDDLVYPPNTAPCITPTTVVTVIYTGTELTLDCTTAPLVIRVVSPLLQSTANPTGEFAEAFFIGEDDTNPGQFVWDLGSINAQPMSLSDPIHKIYVTNTDTQQSFEFTITYTGASPHRLKVDFPPSLRAGNKYVVCGDKYIVCGDKYVLCT